MAQTVSDATHIRLTAADITDSTVHRVDGSTILEIPGDHPVTIEGADEVIRQWLAELYVSVRSRDAA